MSNTKTRTWNKLTELGIQYKTDKAYFHLFTEFYQPYFDTFVDKPINILEIGVSEGNSLLLWKSFFPEATIYGIDVNADCANLKLGDGIHVYTCSQDDFTRMSELFENKKFDIIIDDGSHLCSHQQKSFGFLFPYLNPNGIYVCEDLHTSYKSGYIDTTLSTMQVLENYQKNKRISSYVLDDAQKEYLNQHISEMTIFKRKENAIMCHRCKKINDENKEFCIVCRTILSPLDKSITSVIIHN